MAEGDTREEPGGRRLALLSLAALGVVYGDIGTSPLYAIRECFHGKYGIEPAADNILGVLSLMFWALIVIVTIKYLTFILRADNHGEGGVIALTALAGRPVSDKVGRRWVLIMLGLFAASLLYGDGMITPAISVLSAVEGLHVITPVLKPYVIPITVAILVALFVLQRRGTGRVGILFGPITSLWFLVIASLGIVQICQNPSVLLAVSPTYGASFLIHNGSTGFVVLGAVFLVVTGAEALYADLGHFGRRPIRTAWLYLVLPALLCSYFGQGALLLARPGEAYHPFYALAPEWLLVPLVVLATAATVIASQAVIAGAFSLTRQAMQLGYLPRLRIIHTSESERGQIYIPQINWFLMVCTIFLVLGFQTSGGLAAAYGVAVTTTMLIATILFYVVARKKWHWSRLKAGLPVGIFVVVDLTFFLANISKIAHGAWFPLAIGAVVFLMLTTWKKGRAILVQKQYGDNPPLVDFVSDIASNPPVRVPGKAVFMAGITGNTPPALLHNLKHNKVLHAENAVLTVITEDVPRVERSNKVEVLPMGNGFYRVVGHFGFMEEPNVPHLLAIAREQGLDFDIEEVSFFIGRERLLPDRHPAMSVWREKIFSFMSRNALIATNYFHIPPDQVIELGAQIKI
jgi:KUP system potassium uptake protein